MKKVLIIMGSASDLPIVQKAIDTLDALGIPNETHIYSAHRTPDEAADFAANAKENGFEYYCTTLTVSPHKNAETINSIGSEYAGKYGIKWLFSDFKKRSARIKYPIL